MNRRTCPVCGKPSLPISGLLFSDAECASCRSVVGVHRFASISFAILIFAVTVLTTVAVLAQSGLYAALIWLPFPVGSLSFLKAWLCPLRQVS